MNLTEEYPDDLWDISEIEKGTILRDWHEDGVRVILLRGPFHPCVYFGIPLEHPLSGQSYDDIPINVHGGLTFSDKGDGKWRPEGYWWYGYDYGHCDDYMFSSEPSIKKLYKDIDGKKWTIKEIVNDTWDGLYQFKELMALSEKISNKAALRGGKA